MDNYEYTELLKDLKIKRVLLGEKGGNYSHSIVAGGFEEIS